MDGSGGYEDPALAECYDYIPGHVTRPDVGFYVELARAAGGIALELGCGTGRVLLPVAQAGCPIVGLDLSEAMLARCGAKVLAQPAEVQERVRLVRASMADFGLGERFALVTTPFRAFQHVVSVADQLACLRCAYRHLLRGGRLVLDLFQTNPRRLHDPVYLQEAQDCDDVLLPGGRKLRRTGRTVAFHRAEQCNDQEFIYYVTHPDGRVERLVWAFRFRYYFRYEVEHLLARCGFRVAEVYGNFDRSPLSDDSPEMIFVAEKCASTV